MPSIAKIRLTNVVFEGGAKRFNDLTFQFDGHNGVILLENGGGKTVFIQAALQVVLPHVELADRKIKDTLSLEAGPCHLAIEWIMNENPRRYALTAVSLFLNARGQLDSYRFVYEYSSQDKYQINTLPFVKETVDGKKRPASRGEIRDFYQAMQSGHMAAHTFDTIKAYHHYLEENFRIIPTHWSYIALINSAEGGVEKFFENCKTNGQLVDQLLIPVVEKTMAGKGTPEYVEIFQQQREHFKKHKQLRARIEESQEIEKKLLQYVDLFKEMHLVKTQLLEQKQLAKAVWNYWQQEKESFDRQVANLKEQLEAWEQAESEHRRKKASLRLAQLKQKEENARRQYEQIREEYSTLQEALQDKEKKLQNLKAAELRLRIQEAQESIKLYREQILFLEKDPETEELQEQLAENSSLLKGSFAKEEEMLQQNIAELDARVEETQIILAGIIEELAVLNQEQDALITAKIQAKTMIKALKDEMDNIANEILANPLHEKVEEEEVKWKSRTLAIERQKAEYLELLRQMEGEEEQVREQLNRLNEELIDLKNASALNDRELAELQATQEHLLKRLQELRKDWHYFPSLYQKQATILEYLEEKLEQSRKQREQLLQEERVSYRLQDNYGTQKHFAPEPMLEQLITRWSTQFNLLETGSRYLEKVAGILDSDEESLYLQYPLWALSLITSGTEMGKLVAKVEQQAGLLSYPVLLLTDEEARQIIQEGKAVTERYVFPANWQQNISQTGFSRWKEEIMELARKATEKREAKEKEMEYFRGILADTRNFFQKFPYEKYNLLQEEKLQLKDSLQKTENLLLDKQNRLGQLQKEHQQYNNRLKELEQESILLSSKLQRAQDYLQKEKRKDQETVRLMTVLEQLESKKQEIDRKQQLKARRERVLDELTSQLRQVNDELSQLQADPFYIEVQEAIPKESHLTRKSLLEKRSYIIDALNQKQANRQIIEMNLKHENRIKQDKETELQRLRKEARYPIDEGFVFPPYGVQEMETLSGDLQQLRREIEKLHPIYRQEEKSYHDCRQEYLIREQDFFKEFPAPVTFTEPLEEIRFQLDKEQQALEEQRDYLNRREKQTMAQIREVETALQELKAKNERYDFLMPEIAEIAVPPALLPRLPYRRLKTVQELIDEFEKLTDDLQKELGKLEQYKMYFISFCEKNILDIRLREMVVSGLKTKEEYEEVMEWQRNLTNRITRIIAIAEEDIREHDKELQQFIHYLHTHVTTLAQELRMIPKNTRVKAGDTWKDVFSFDVPTWEEEDGKEELRKHVDWMLAQLGSSRFLNEQGLEDQALIRNSIEQWLQSKQLLQIVLKGKEIKIRCRKVTHDGSVSNSLFSWETSNVWSGGEKWSKNMALFLGIMNYAAEKRHHLGHKKQKRQRTVILDNPFGKASSDHVLFPVFYIAEQLGFQLIALTAHAEGKFIRDYFPIVYSCKLRPTTDDKSLMVDTDKTISYAYFRDHDPQALFRLEELEQLSILDW